MKGKFITVEGSDGSGKTSFINFATEYLKEKGYKVITTREPGGTEFSEKVRELLFQWARQNWSNFLDRVSFFIAISLEIRPSENRFRLAQ